MMDLVYDPVKNPDILKSPYYQRVSDRLNTFKNLRLYDTGNANFREIDSITVVTESIYTTLEESGKLNELTQALASGNMQEVFEARQELLQYTTSVRQGTCPLPRKASSCSGNTAESGVVPVVMILMKLRFPVLGFSLGNGQPIIV